jgi:MFS family permease
MDPLSASAFQLLLDPADRGAVEAQPKRESRLSRGWRLTIAAWRLMRQDPTMVALALLATGCWLVGVGLMLYLGGVFTDHYSRAHFWVVSLAFVYPLTFLGAFFNVALTAAAAASLEDRWLDVRSALGEAVGRLRQIAVWSLLLVGVGFILNEIAARVPYVGALLARGLGAAWNLGTIFAIPLLTLEDADPLEAVQGSARLVKSKWGEGLTGMVSIGAWTVLAMVPIVVSARSAPPSPATTRSPASPSSASPPLHSSGSWRWQPRRGRCSRSLSFATRPGSRRRASSCAISKTPSKRRRVRPAGVPAPGPGSRSP